MQTAPNPAGGNMSVSALTPSISSHQSPPLSTDVGKKSDTGKAPVAQTQLGVNVSADKRQAALQVVNNTLAKAYEKLGLHSTSPAADYAAFEPLTAEKVANNILGFIERRLQLDKADGATQEQLQSRLEAGLEGFKKGFAQASEQLKALDMLSPEVAADIGKTNDLVLKGIDDLRSKFITNASSPQTPAASENQTLKTAPKPAAKLDVPDFVPKAKSQDSYSNYEYARAREFSFELTTKEGDKVRITASASEGFAYEANENSKGKSVNGSYSASQAMSLQVEGNLSDEELGAINELLGKVNDLAGEFFDGDLDKAFAQAQELGYDDKQIGSFSLNLAKVDIQQFTQAYKNLEPANDSQTAPALSEQLLPLGHFIRDLLNSLQEASAFPEPGKLISNLAKAGTEDEKQGTRLQAFVDKMLGLMDAEQNLTNT
jgi:hypothetical protein